MERTVIIPFNKTAASETVDQEEEIHSDRKQLKFSDMASGWIKGSTAVIIRVYQEKADNSKGKLLFSEGLINEDEYVEIQNVERQRIIFDYKYEEEDPWNVPSVHAWCYEDKEDAQSVP